MRPVLTSTKHYVQFTQFTVATTAVLTQTIIDAVAVDQKNALNEVNEGSIVKAVFLEYWLLSDANAFGSFVLTVEKTVGGESAPILSEMTTLGAYKNKKNVLFTSQGLIADGTAGNPTPVLRQWIKIPKGKQRFGFDDALRVNIAGIGTETINGCAFATYKEYT